MSTRTSTSTRTEPAGSAATRVAGAAGASTRVALACERRGGATRAARLAATGLLRARLLRAGDGVLRVALVQTAAALLSGDRVSIDVRLAPGARVEILEIAGLVAHDARGGAGAEFDVCVSLDAGARLHWAAQPLVLAAGCDLRRRIDLNLADGAALLLRDTLVLGRAGEEPGALRSTLTVSHAGSELHVETLDTADRTLLRSPVVLGAAKVLDTLAIYGERATHSDAMQLAGPGTVLPLPAPSLAAAARRLAAPAAAWREALLNPSADRDRATAAPA